MASRKYDNSGPRINRKDSRFGPVPSQITTWMHFNIASGEAEREPEFLYALKDTRGGDRQIIWEGGTGRGLVAVVDFADSKLSVNGRWRSWGLATMLPRPITPDELRGDDALQWRFSSLGLRALQGLPKRLTPEEGAAIAQVAGGLPRRALPDHLPRVGEPVHDWFGELDLDPEKTFELAVHTSRYIWRKIGFSEAPVIQERLAGPTGQGTLIPDLLAPGLLGEVKRVLTPSNGPAQIEAQLDRVRTTRARSGPWRGVLIHGDDRISDSVRRRPDGSDDSIEVWAVLPGKVRQWKTVRQYP